MATVNSANFEYKPFWSFGRYTNNGSLNSGARSVETYPSVFGTNVVDKSQNYWTSAANSSSPSVFTSTGAVPGVITPSYGVSTLDETNNDRELNTAAASSVLGATGTSNINSTTNTANNTAQTISEAESSGAANSASALKPSTLGSIYDDESGTMTAEQLKQAQRMAREYVMMPTLNEAVKKNVLTKEDVEKYLNDGSIPDEKKAAFSEFCQKLRENRETLDAFYKDHLKEDENGNMVPTIENLESQYKAALADGIVTDEELAEITNQDENWEKPEETEKPEERPADQEGKPGREEEVINAYNMVMDAAENGQDLKALAESSGNADVKRIVSDLEDDGIVGNGAAAAQFESNVIQNAIQKRSQQACDNKLSITVGGKKVDYNGSYDQNDNKTTSSRKKKTEETK